jgi:hypothetical protein
MPQVKPASATSPPTADGWVHQLSVGGSGAGCATATTPSTASPSATSRATSPSRVGTPAGTSATRSAGAARCSCETCRCPAGTSCPAWNAGGEQGCRATPPQRAWLLALETTLFRQTPSPLCCHRCKPAGRGRLRLCGARGRWRCACRTVATSSPCRVPTPRLRRWGALRAGPDRWCRSVAANHARGPWLVARPSACWGLPTPQNKPWMCSHACNALLPCEHPCTSSCGRCLEGWAAHELGFRSPAVPASLETEQRGSTLTVRLPSGDRVLRLPPPAEWLHRKCTGACGRTLFCGHRCEGRCHQGSECPPCRKPCGVQCMHSKCGKACGDLCPPCAEPCPWDCPHQVGVVQSASDLC